MTHRWVDRRVIDCNTTLRTCPKCKMRKFSRHEPDNDPPHWYEYQFGDGPRIPSARVPACNPIPDPITRGPREPATADSVGGK